MNRSLLAAVLLLLPRPALAQAQTVGDGGQAARQPGEQWIEQVRRPITFFNVQDPQAECRMAIEEGYYEPNWNTAIGKARWAGAAIVDEVDNGCDIQEVIPGWFQVWRVGQVTLRMPVESPETAGLDPISAATGQASAEFAEKLADEFIPSAKRFLETWARSRGGWLATIADGMWSLDQGLAIREMVERAERVERAVDQIRAGGSADLEDVTAQLRQDLDELQVSGIDRLYNGWSNRPRSTPLENLAESPAFFSWLEDHARAEYGYEAAMAAGDEAEKDADWEAAVRAYERAVAVEFEGSARFDEGERRAAAARKLEAARARLAEQASQDEARQSQQTDPVGNADDFWNGGEDRGSSATDFWNGGGATPVTQGAPAQDASTPEASPPEAVSEADLVGTTYTLCEPREDPVYSPGQAETCFEYHLGQNGQTIRMFWIDRLDTGRIENEGMSHGAWILDDGHVVIQGEQLRYGQDPIYFYDVHEITETGDLSWVRREVDRNGETETKDLTADSRVLVKDEAQGPAKFRAQMERDSRFSRPAATEWDPEAYWSEIVSQYPARYMRGR